MKEMKFISDYKSNDQLRKSFNTLAMETFGQGIDFESWYQAGYWNTHYKCYSYIVENVIVANVSVNEMTIIVKGQTQKALQIGTVMTHEDYRRQGLSRKLFDKVFEDYEGLVDYIYLFGNDLAKPLYLKCGFEPMEECEFISNAHDFKTKEIQTRKLNLSLESDLSLIKKMSDGRTPISNTFGVTNDQHLIMFYCSKFMYDTLYYIEDIETIVSYEIKEGVLHIYDVISRGPIELKGLVEGLIDTTIKSVVYHFTPDLDASLYQVEVLKKEDSTLLVRQKKNHIDQGFQYPLFSHA